MNFKEMNLPLLQDADIDGKVVLVRVDHNVVKKGEIHDTFRIDQTFETIKHIRGNGGKPVLMTHVGRPRDKKTGKINISDNTSVEPIRDYLADKLGLNIDIPEFNRDGDKGYTGMNGNMDGLLGKLKGGEIDMIYLPNTRWFAGEEAKGDERQKFAKELAGLADIYVNDAFGSWQPHASTAAVVNYLPGYAGLLMQKELKNLQRLFEPDRPYLAVVAGAKFDTKVETLNKLLETADYLVLGGIMYNTYLAAKYGLKIQGVTGEEIESAKPFVEECERFPGKLIEMPYIIESDTLDEHSPDKARTKDVRDLAKGARLNYVLDIGPQSFADDKVKTVFATARTIFVNAVMGYTPKFNDGTEALNKYIADNEAASKFFGGGDTLQELKKLNPEVYKKALDSKQYYLFTGGGAVLKALEEQSVLGIEPVKMLTEQK